MTPQEILDKLNSPNVAVERLLDECRAPDAAVWKENSELYFAFVSRLIAQGHPGRALDLAREGEAYLKDQSKLQFQLALAAARGGNPRYAESLLAPLLAKVLGPTSSLPVDMTTALRVDVISLQGRVLKDRSTREPSLTLESAVWYERAAGVEGACDLSDKGTFPLINAATMYRLAGDKERSKSLAAEVVKRIEGIAEEEATKGNLWLAATLGEAMLLLDRHTESIAWYLRAVDVAIARGDVGNLASIRSNIRRLQAAGATANSDFLDEELGIVVVFSGHMIDSPERLQSGVLPRFPNDPALIAAVGSAIRTKLDELNAKVGYCSLACGGDILFAEAMLQRGAELHLVLPFAEEDFLQTSVDFGQTTPPWAAWRNRYFNVLAKVKQASVTRVRYATQEPFLGSKELFAFTNSILQGLAVLRGKERAGEPTALTLMDRSANNLTGGTGDFLSNWKLANLVDHEIDLAAIRNSLPITRQSSEPPSSSPAVSTLKRPVKAMLFADVAGFSGIQERELVTFLTSYSAYLRDLFASPIGQTAIYANTWGDGLYVVFDQVEDAAVFATELVEPTVGKQPEWSTFGLGDINPFRVGLHAGPVFEMSNLFQGRSEFAGQHVNRAARIEPVTLRGCAYASEPFAALLTMEAGNHFVIEAVGVHSLAKNYDRCHLYRVSR